MDNFVEGEELIGLSIWHDRNSDGLSQATEVQPVTEFGIVSLNYFEIEMVKDTLVSREGVRFHDGTTGNIWDWISQEVKNIETPNNQPEPMPPVPRPGSLRRAQDR